jgi:hypothetical protein
MEIIMSLLASSLAPLLDGLISPRHCGQDKARLDIP